MTFNFFYKKMIYYYYFKLCGCVFMWVCACERRNQRRILNLLALQLQAVGKSPQVGAGNQTGILWKRRTRFVLPSHLTSPSPSASKPPASAFATGVLTTSILWGAGGKLRACSSLNVTVSRQLIGCGAVERRDHAGVNAALLKEVCPCRRRL